MTSKQRAELKAQAMNLDSIFQIGKSSLTPQTTDAIKAAIKARELVKISVLKNCDDDPAELAKLLAERTDSEVVQVIGKKIVLYKKNMQKEEKRRLREKREAKRKEETKQRARAQKKETAWTRQDSLRKKKENEKKRKLAGKVK